MSARSAIFNRAPVLLVGFWAMLGSSRLWSESYRLDLAPERTSITFSLAATLHRVRGSLALESGVILFDTGTHEAEGELVVLAASAETGHERRDRDMHRKVLKSDEFPLMTFYPTRVEGDPTAGLNSEIVLEGEIELQGDRHAVVWSARTTTAGDSLIAEIEFEVPYVEWGLRDPSKLVLRVGKSVWVQVRTEGTLIVGDAG